MDKVNTPQSVPAVTPSVPGQTGVETPAVPTTPVNPLEAKLEGDAVPERFRGKTVADVMKSYGEAEDKMMKALNEAEQWRKFGEKSIMAATQQSQKPVDTFNPLEHLDENTAKAVTTIASGALEEFNKAVLVPVIEGISAMQLEFVKASRPDFSQHEKRAREYFESMPVHVRVNPAYGYDFAYRLAKAEAMGGPSLIPATPAPPSLGPSQGGTPAPAGPRFSEDQMKWMGLMGMSPEDYAKYAEPIDVVGEAMKKGGKK